MSSLSLAEWHNRFSEQAAWTAELRRRWLRTLPASARVLEVGCGTGAVASAASAESPAARLFGLDLAPDRVFFAAKNVKRAGIRWLAGDGAALPFDDSTFDAAICHYLLLWVTNPTRLVGEMARIVRPGGHIAALAEPDYFARIDYPPALAIAGLLQRESLARQGADPGFGRRLAALFADAGLRILEAGILGGCWQPSAGAEVSEARILEADLGGVWSQADKDAYAQADRTARESGARVLFVPTFYCMASRPENA